MSKITIITISYNQEKFIERTLTSVLEQNYSDLEYILVDPGSSDNSRSIIDKYSKRINKIIYEKDSGPADGLNKGIRISQGEIIGFVNSDDILLPGALEYINKYFNCDQDVDIYLGSGMIINSDDKILRKVYCNMKSLSKHSFLNMTFIQPSIFFRRNLFFDISGFNVENSTCWDGEFLIDAFLAKKKFSFNNKMLSAFRIHKNSISGSQIKQKKYLEDKERLKHKLLGRNETFVDKLLRIFYYVLKLFYEPRNAYQHLLYLLKCKFNVI